MPSEFQKAIHSAIEEAKNAGELSSKEITDAMESLIKEERIIAAGRRAILASEPNWSPVSKQFTEQLRRSRKQGQTKEGLTK